MVMTNRPPSVILAGGLARRMGGGHKSMLQIDGVPMLDHVIQRLKPQVSQIALNVNGDTSKFSAYNLPTFADTIPGFLGPLAGILSGLRWAQNLNSDCLISVAADTPFFPENLVEKLANYTADMNEPLALAFTRDEKGKVLRHPTFGIWPVSLADNLENALLKGLRKIVLWVDQNDGRGVEFDQCLFNPFFNVNSPDDLAEAERLIGMTK